MSHIGTPPAPQREPPPPLSSMLRNSADTLQAGIEAGNFDCLNDSDKMGMHALAAFLRVSARAARTLEAIASDNLPPLGGGR